MDSTTLTQPAAATTASSEPASVRVAVATKDGIAVDLHFGHVRAFDVYEADEAGVTRLERRSIDQYCKEDDDRATRMKGILQVIGDCQGVLIARIGPVPKEMLAAAGLDAADEYAFQPVEEAVAAFAAGWRSRSTAAPEPEAPGAAERLLHTMLRVSDIEASIDFYTRLLGMQVIDRREHRKNQFTQVYLGYGDGTDAIGLELVQNWDREEPYQQGDAFGHIAIAVTGINALCRRLEAEGVKMPRPPLASAMATPSLRSSRIRTATGSSSCNAPPTPPNRRNRAFFGRSFGFVRTARAGGSRTCSTARGGRSGRVWHGAC